MKTLPPDAEAAFEQAEAAARLVPHPDHWRFAGVKVEVRVLRSARRQGDDYVFGAHPIATTFAEADYGTRTRGFYRSIGVSVDGADIEGALDLLRTTLLDPATRGPWSRR